LEISYRYMWCMVSLIAEYVYILTLLRFLYDFVTFPNGVFSGIIISSVMHHNDIKKAAEWQLRLSSSIVLPGVVIGALLRNSLGRRNTVSPRSDRIIHDSNPMS
jgi:ABC-type molybdate transport system permease subunit